MARSRKSFMAWSLLLFALASVFLWKLHCQLFLILIVFLMLAKLLKISKKSHGNPRKTPLLWQTFFLKGLESIKTSLKFTIFVLSYNTSIESYIFTTSTEKCFWLTLVTAWLYDLIMPRTRFRVNPSTLYSCLNVKELLARNILPYLSLGGCNETRTHNHLVGNCFLWKWSFHLFSDLFTEWKLFTELYKMMKHITKIVKIRRRLFT